jgi:hypothetical protein
MKGRVSSFYIRGFTHMKGRVSSLYIRDSPLTQGVAGSPSKLLDVGNKILAWKSAQQPQYHMTGGQMSQIL